MNKLVYSALALTLVSATGYATENEWSSLDQEINSLTSSLAAQNTAGPKIGGWVITSFRNSNDLIGGGGNDLSGVQLDTVRVEISGDAGEDYGYKISFDVASGSAVLKDAYATFKIGDYATGKMGNFKTPFLRSGLVADNKLLFLERSGLGAIFAARDKGLMFNGNFDTINWFLSGQNGNDGMGNDYKFAAKVEANLMGGGVGKVEGAYGSGDDTNLTVGLAWQDDNNLDKGRAIAAEAALSTGPFSISAELVDFDDDYTNPNPVLAQWGIVGNAVGNSTPWDATVSYMFTDMWEAAVRYQDSDDAENTSAYTIGLNRYVKGHDIKWQAEWEHVKTDNAFGDFSVLGIGLAVSF